ncbi:uncharacterized protein LOC119681266 [Teleopsis dalmanni]|uniref:uncharacterized protein LOC119681266 n=1 Tax=Teleopsis dalmanni TaxID=139649 RepID=UPI0018CCE6B2|nr:uncharacterized protein LOC119681266 [Teleopsis dalmanni]
MSRKILNCLQKLMRSFSKNHSNIPKVEIVEKRKIVDNEDIVKSYNKPGEAGICNFSTLNGFKTYNWYIPYEHNTRMDEEYSSEVNLKNNYLSPYAVYKNKVNDKPTRKHELKQPTSNIVNSYYEIIRQKKNALIPTDRKTKQNKNSLSASIASYSDNYNNKIQSSHRKKDTYFTNTPTLKFTSTHVKRSSEVSRLDDVHNEILIPKKEYIKSLHDVVEENGLKWVVNMENSDQYLKFKSPTCYGEIKSQISDFVNYKDVRRSTTTTDITNESLPTTLQKETKKDETVKGYKSNMDYKSSSNSFEAIESSIPANRNTQQKLDFSDMTDWYNFTWSI